MTIYLLIAALSGIGFVCARLGRTAVQLALSYLALRRSKPTERKEILEALGPVLGVVGSRADEEPAGLAPFRLSGVAPSAPVPIRHRWRAAGQREYPGAW